MSVTFGVRGELREIGEELNLAHVNAGDLLRALGLYAEDLSGEVRAMELRARIAGARALPDHGRAGGTTSAGALGARFIEGARRPGRMAEYLEQLEELCDVAGEISVIWWG